MPPRQRPSSSYRGLRLRTNGSEPSPVSAWNVAPGSVRGGQGGIDPAESTRRRLDARQGSLGAGGKRAQTGGNSANARRAQARCPCMRAAAVRRTTKSTPQLQLLTGLYSNGPNTLLFDLYTCFLLCQSVNDTLSRRSTRPLSSIRIISSSRSLSTVPAHDRLALTARVGSAKALTVASFLPKIAERDKDVLSRRSPR